MKVLGVIDQIEEQSLHLLLLEYHSRNTGMVGLFLTLISSEQKKKDYHEYHNILFDFMLKILLLVLKILFVYCI